MGARGSHQTRAAAKARIRRNPAPGRLATGGGRLRGRPIGSGAAHGWSGLSASYGLRTSQDDAADHVARVAAAVEHSFEQLEKVFQEDGAHHLVRSLVNVSQQFDEVLVRLSFDFL